MTDPLQAAVDKMRADGAAETAVRTFAQHHRRLRSGDAAVLAETDIEPVRVLPDADDLPADDDAARDALAATVIIKLNGGLGTSMGLRGPKALLEVREGLSFLDITVRQVMALRRRTGAPLPLLMLHSFATRELSLAALGRHGGLAVDGVPLEVVQSRVPKLRADDLSPISWPADPSLEWAPPGHGDLYAAMGDGVLDRLLAAGYRHAFASNVDNLGAVLDERILAWFAREDMPLLMEVADRTAADRKGGHLARRPGGRLVLREVAQTPAEDLESFQDIGRHRFFNTNSLWLDLPRLKALLDPREGVLGLPMIVNRKTVDPTDVSSPAVIQLETAMGAAIDVIRGARAVRVPRTRFIPVKTTDDLLALRSDAYDLREDGRVVLAPPRTAAGRGTPEVRLDPACFTLVDDFEARLPAGPPSLVDADRLVVEGDVRFGAGVVVHGDVTVRADPDEQVVVPDGTVLTG